MKVLQKTAVLILFLSLLVKCKEDDITGRPYPRINTLPVTEITHEGARFSAEIIFRGDFEVLNYGFVWGEFEEATIHLSDKIIYGENIQLNNFSAYISTTLKEGVRYFVKSFIQTKDYTVYGENIQFTSLGSGAPEIKSISPLAANFCDTIFIRGTNFSYVKEQNSLKFGPIDTEVVDASDTLIKAFVPGIMNSTDFKVSVSIFGNEAISKESITIKKPEILQISPENVVLGGLISIVGDNFTKTANTNIVLINGIRAKVFSAGCNELKAIIPVTNTPLQISVSNFTSLESEAFYINLLEPVINDLNPDMAYIGGQVVINGNNFGSLDDGIIIKVDSLTAGIVSHSNTSIVIKVPNGIYNKRLTNVTAFILSKSISSKELTILNPWLRKTDIPTDQDRYASVGFSFGGFGYVGLGATRQDFWKYDPNDNSWLRVADFPGPPRWGASSFVIGECAYVGGGSNNSGMLDDFWKYNIVNNTWEQISKFPYPISAATGLSNEEKGYIVTFDDVNNFWSYDPISDVWSQMPDLNTISSGPKGKADAGFALNNKLFIYASGNSTGLHQLYEFDINSSLWTRKADMVNFEILTRAIGFSFQNKGYVSADCYLYEYDPANNSWKVKTQIPGSLKSGSCDREEPVAFVINEQIYLGGGICGTSSDHDLWEFDPAFN